MTVCVWMAWCVCVRVYPVTNIGFEQAHANVKRYFATFWLESFKTSEYTQLQYSQNITLAIPLPGGVVDFPHILTNTLTKVQPKKCK